MSVRRSPAQELQASSEAKLMQIFSCWVVNKFINDFGIDFEVRFTDDKSDNYQDVMPECFYVQLRASHKFDGLISEDLNVPHLKLYWLQKIPVVLIKCYNDNDTFYWEIIQDYIEDILEKEDENWRNQITKRIKLRNQLTDLNILKEQIISSQKRITKLQAFFMPIGEGIRYSPDNLNELTNHRTKALEEFKKLGVIEADRRLRVGSKNEAQAILLDVITSPKNDLTKIMAIIYLIWTLNIAIDQENQQIIDYAAQGIKIARELKLDYLGNYLIINKNQALLFRLSSHISSISASKMIADKTTEGIYSFLYVQELVNVTKSIYPLIQEIDDALVALKDENSYFFIISLSLVLDVISTQIYHLAVFDKKVIEIEKDRRDGLIDLCELSATAYTNPDLRKIMYKSLSTYYYHILDHKKAIEYLEKAIKNGELDNDLAFVEWNSKLLETMKSKPDPYEFKKGEFKDATLKELKELVEMFFAKRGYLKTGDEHSKSIKIALEDLDSTRIFKFCENVFAEYISISQLGRILGLPSLGSKMIWCKYVGCLVGFNLQSMFNSFIEEHCASCEYKKPRATDWECTVGWLETRNKNPAFRGVINNFLSSLRQ